MTERTRFSSARYGPAERQMAESLVEIEQQILHGAEEPDCDCKDGMFDGLSRRNLLAGGSLFGWAAIAGSSAHADAPPGAVEYDVQPDPTKEQGRLILDDGGYGSRSQFENEIRWRYPTASLDFELVDDAACVRIRDHHTLRPAL